MGGYDLFESTGHIGGTWSIPLNCGYPVNSTKDDLGYTGWGKGLMDDAQIISDRASACCLETYSVHRTGEKPGRSMAGH